MPTEYLKPWEAISGKAPFEPITEPMVEPIGGGPTSVRRRDLPDGDRAGGEGRRTGDLSPMNAFPVPLQTVRLIDEGEAWGLPELQCTGRAPGKPVRTQLPFATPGRYPIDTAPEGR